MKFLLPVFFACSLFLVACGPQPVYESTHNFASGNWAYRDTVDFTFNLKDTATIYQIWLNFEHKEMVPFQNVYVKLYTKFPDGKRVSKVCSFNLYDQQGKALGEKSGDSWAMKSLLQEHAYFKQTGDYTITVEQFTRQDSLPGIKSVSLMLEKSDPPAKK